MSGNRSVGLGTGQCQSVTSAQVKSGPRDQSTKECPDPTASVWTCRCIKAVNRDSHRRRLLQSDFHSDRLWKAMHRAARMLRAKAKRREPCRKQREAAPGPGQEAMADLLSVTVT